MSNIVRTWEDEALPAGEIELTDAQLASVYGACKEECSEKRREECEFEEKRRLRVCEEEEKKVIVVIIKREREEERNCDRHFF